MQQKAKHYNMGRKQLNHVQYKRNIQPDFVDKMDKHLNKLKETFKTESEKLTKNTEG